MGGTEVCLVGKGGSPDLPTGGEFTEVGFMPGTVRYLEGCSRSLDLPGCLLLAEAVSKLTSTASVHTLSRILM